MFKKFLKRRNCNHNWHEVNSDISAYGPSPGDISRKYTIYCPICDKKKKNISGSKWEEMKRIERVKTEYLSKGEDVDDTRE